MSPTTEQADRALIGIAAAQTAYALNNGGGIVVGQPLVYIDDFTTIGESGAGALNPSIPTGYIVRGVYKDRQDGTNGT